MRDLRSAAEKALEALEFMADEWGFTQKANRPERWQAIDALRAALKQPNKDYERGFVDGMSEQAKRSVDRAVNRMADAVERTLTDEVIADLWHQNGGFHHHFARAVERWLKGEK